MAEINDGEIREFAAQKAKDFKSSWIELGRALHSVWNDKVFKYWGYTTFEAYTQKELGIRNNTASKLLKSYYFLEKNEPKYLSKEYYEEAEATQVPQVDAVNALRLAKNNKNLNEKDYQALKEDVFEKGRDDQTVRKSLTALVKERQQVDPEEAKEQSRLLVIKRFLSTLKSTKREMEALSLVPKKVLKHIEEVIEEFGSLRLIFG